MAATDHRLMRVDQPVTGSSSLPTHTM
ncbi:hypothetical protein TIFTF001_053841, partial [Ficus carica]